jgi:signal transduction histidine kinase
MENARKIFTGNKLFLTFMAANMMVIATATTSRFVVNLGTAEMERGFELRLIETAKRGASMISAEDLGEYRDAADMEKPSYSTMKKNLRDLAADAGVPCIYYFRVSDGKAQYIVDNDFDLSTRGGLDTPPIDSALIPGLETTLAGRASSSGLGNYMPGWPGLMSGYAPIVDANGRVAAVCGVSVNDSSIISARRRRDALFIMEAASITVVALSGMYCLAAYNREARLAKIASAAKTEFLSKVSHEMRTPLTVISVKAQTVRSMLEKTERASAAMEMLDAIKEESIRLARMSGAMIALEIASSEFKEMSSLDVTGFIRTVSSIYRTLAEHSGNRLTVDMPDGLPRAIGNADGISQVLINLISNANKHTKDGEIRLAVSYNSGMFTVEVSDDGEGIPPEDLKKIFDRKPHRGHGAEAGGIGLSICKDIIEAHGGSISMKSEPGAGTTVRFTLPAEGGPDGR